MKNPLLRHSRLVIGLAAATLTAGLGISQLMAQTSAPNEGGTIEVDTIDVDTIDVDNSTFDCLTDMTPVRGFFVSNLLGDLQATLSAAHAEQGAPYPAGSVVQLVPTEVMIKQPEGTSPETNDWEFFELEVSAEGSEIVTRGFTDVVNRFGGNCLDCHIKAEPQWDMVCETGHGCDPLPLSREMLTGIQQADPRCRAPEA